MRMDGKKAEMNSLALFGKPIGQIIPIDKNIHVGYKAVMDKMLYQLKLCYRIQFPVRQSYEADTWYDAEGRIVLFDRCWLYLS